MYNIAALIIILLCLAGIVAIILKRLPLLAMFDVNAIPEEKEAETKHKIIEQRLNRKLNLFYGKIKPFFKLVANFWQRQSVFIRERLAKLEEKYKHKTRKEILVTKDEFQTLETKIANILAEAANFVKTEEYGAAEKKYIEILSLDAKNLDAYRGLAELYSLQKHYPEAIQTYQHILKMDRNNVAAMVDLAQLFLAVDNLDSAQEQMEKALILSPNSPKYLDLLLEISIMNKNKALAKQTLVHLQEVNPDNVKIGDWERKIKEL